MGQFITHSTTGDVDTIVGGYAFTNVSTALYAVHPTIVIVRTINATARDLNQLYRIKLIVVNSFYWPAHLVHRVIFSSLLMDS